MNEIKKCLDHGLENGVFTAASYSMGKLGERDQEVAIGKTRSDSLAKPITPQTYFDLASLTKVLFTTTVIARWVDRKIVKLETPLVQLLPDLPWNSGWLKVTLKDVLIHCAGFEAWRDFRKVKRPIEEEIALIPPAYPTGSETRYSDLGFILLGSYLEKRGQKPLKDLLDDEVNRWLKKEPFLPSPLEEKLKEKVPATEDVPDRGGVIQGEVHDGNAWKLGGLSGHAGLFGTAGACTKIGLLWLDAILRGNSFLSQPVAKEFARAYPTPKGETRGLGWTRPTFPGSSGGKLISKNSIGHLGYTGTSIWIDIDREVVAVLLTNRTYPTAKNEEIKRFRPEFYDTVWKTLDK